MWLEPPTATSAWLCSLTSLHQNTCWREKTKSKMKRVSWTKKQGHREGNGALVLPGCNGGKKDGGIAPQWGVKEAQSSPGDLAHVPVTPTLEPQLSQPTPLPHHPLFPPHAPSFIALPSSSPGAGGDMRGSAGSLCFLQMKVLLREAGDTTSHL